MYSFKIKSRTDLISDWELAEIEINKELTMIRILLIEYGYGGAKLP